MIPTRHLSLTLTHTIREKSRFPAVLDICRLVELFHLAALGAWLLDNTNKSHTAWGTVATASARRMQGIPMCRQDVFAIGE